MKHRRLSGFTLTELAVTLVLAGLFSGLVLKVNAGQIKREDCVRNTQHQLHTIHEAIGRFVNSKDRFPLPAERNLGIEDKSFGREATLVTLDSNSGVTFGALPFQALGLSPAYASDCWGNKFTYAVTTDLTDSLKFNSTSPVYNGAIVVKSSAINTVNSSIGYAVISHGANAIGAAASNYSGVSKKWCSLGTTLESENCEVSNNVLISATYNDGASAGNNSFDDVVIYAGKNPRAIDGVCSSPLVLNTCLNGTVDNAVAGACGTSDTWDCKGSYGGVTANCTIANAPCPTCVTPWGATIADGSSVPAYSAATHANCASISETRTCTGGVLSGSNTFGACSPPGGCTAPWGATIADGSSVPAYSAATHVNCASISETRTCTGGVLSGSNTFGACAPPGGCTTPWGTSIANGTPVTAYSAATHANCASISETRTCTGGVLSGSYTYGTCAPPGGCTTPWGTSLANGASVTAYSASSATDCTVAGVSETRTCTGGVLSGSFTKGTCIPTAGSCTTPWGATVANGTPVTAYSASSAPDCSVAGVSETRSCTGGVLSGSYTFGTCTSTAGSCSYSGTITWGAGCSAFYSGTVSNGGSASAGNTAAGYTGSVMYSCSGGTWAEAASVCNVAPVCSNDPQAPVSCAAFAGSYGIPATHTVGMASWTINSCSGAVTYTGGCSAPVVCTNNPQAPVSCAAYAGSYGIPATHTSGMASWTINSCSGAITYTGGCSAPAPVCGGKSRLCAISWDEDPFYASCSASGGTVEVSNCKVEWIMSSPPTMACFAEPKCDYRCCK
jgi:type II secretory pathway pseudopilin PulG